MIIILLWYKCTSRNNWLYREWYCGMLDLGEWKWETPTEICTCFETNKINKKLFWKPLWTKLFSGLTCASWGSTTLLLYCSAFMPFARWWCAHFLITVFTTAWDPISSFISVVVAIQNTISIFTVAWSMISGSSWSLVETIAGFLGLSCKQSI